VFLLSLIQLVNQELTLPRMADMLLRDHGQIGEQRVDAFEVSYCRDAMNNAVLQSPSFDPATNSLEGPTILVRNAQGRATSRITAERAQWNAARQGWELEDGMVVELVTNTLGRAQTGASARRPIDFFATDLSPDVLTVRHYGQFASMLSLRQISEMLSTPGVMNEETLMRYRYSRFATVLVNLLVMVISLPSFLLREPSKLMLQTMRCAALSIGSLVGAAIFMLAELPGITPAVGVFLPVIVLLPLALGRMTAVRT
jgi:lipopolysaccharide export LptBFGC system permease protein LptF